MLLYTKAWVSVWCFFQTCSISSLLLYFILWLLSEIAFFLQYESHNNHRDIQVSLSLFRLNRKTSIASIVKSFDIWAFSVSHTEQRNRVQSILFSYLTVVPDHFHLYRWC